MLSYKEFYIWLEGYLYGKLENKNIDITPIVEKMGQVKEDKVVNTQRPMNIPMPINPFKFEDDDLGKPPKIVM